MDLLKPSQNKTGQKKIPLSFSQLPAVKKDTKTGAPGYFFGPSYFVTTLVNPSTFPKVRIKIFTIFLINHVEQVCLGQIFVTNLWFERYC